MINKLVGDKPILEYPEEWEGNPYTLYYEEPISRAIEYKYACRDKALNISSEYPINITQPDAKRSVTGYTSIVQSFVVGNNMYNDNNYHCEDIQMFDEEPVKSGCSIETEVQNEGKTLYLNKKIRTETVVCESFVQDKVIDCVYACVWKGSTVRNDKVC